MNSEKKQFGWKRKIGANVSKSASNAFEDDAKDDDDTNKVDWLNLMPLKKTRVIGLEDGKSKATRLVQDGTVLASTERYWEALKKWDEALLYTPCDAKIHEMKTQVLMELCEVYPAVQAAMKAVECDPTWWIAHQTLGRAHLCLGEVKLALKSFSRAVHLNPGDRGLWDNDLMWANTLLQRKQRLDEEKSANIDKRTSSVTITELDSAENAEFDSSGSYSSVDVYTCRPDQSEMHYDKDEGQSSSKTVKRIPKNYVQMRDPT